MSNRLAGQRVVEAFSHGRRSTCLVLEGLAKCGTGSSPSASAHSLFYLIKWKQCYRMGEPASMIIAGSAVRLVEFEPCCRGRTDCGQALPVRRPADGSRRTIRAGAAEPLHVSRFVHPTPGRPGQRTAPHTVSGLSALPGGLFRGEPDLGKRRNGGEGGIRTHGTRKGTTVFETVPFDHSGTSPCERSSPHGAGPVDERRA